MNYIEAFFIPAWTSVNDANIRSVNGVFYASYRGRIGAGASELAARAALYRIINAFGPAR